MDEETRAAFGRMDRYFELSQAQHLELRTEMNAGFAQLRTEFTGQHEALRAEMYSGFAEIRSEISVLRSELNALKAEFRAFRDWVTREFAAVRTTLQQLSLRLERLENRRKDPTG